MEVFGDVISEAVVQELQEAMLMRLVGCGAEGDKQRAVRRTPPGGAAKRLDEIDSAAACVLLGTLCAEQLPNALISLCCVLMITS